MRFMVALALMTVFLSPALIAQPSVKGTLSGRVLDDSTGFPVSNVNVFLSGTSLGTTTDEKGEFVLRGIPPGTYELVTSIVGYLVDVRPVRVSGAADGPEDTRLKPMVYDLPMVEISAPDPGEWRENLKTFTELLLGYSANASSCTILNPHGIDFFVDPKTGAFTAKADQPLIIENRALGYRIEYVLRQFELKGAILKYTGHSKFVDLEASDEEQLRRWKQNRWKSYRGSMQHLLASMAQRTLRREGFLLQLAKDMSLARSGVSRKPAASDDLLMPTSMPFEQRLSFPDYLEVRFLREPAERGFARFLGVEGTSTSARFSGNEINYQTNLGDAAEVQVSWLRMNVFSTTITADGVPADPRAITTYGYLSYERLAEMVPLDFISTSKEADLR
ncbi:MAG: carboxypeptidase-like regulatory domain-containing protein [Bacteroidota bacterium]